MQIAKELAGFCGAKADDLRKAIGKKNREAMAKLKPEFVAGCARVGHAPRRSSSWLWATNEKSRRLLVQQVPRRLLRADRLPHGVAEGQLPGRVHGGADLLGDGDEGQGPVLRRALRGDGDRDPAARRQPLRPRVRRRRGQHPLRPRRGQGRRLPGRRGDQGGARGGRPVHVAVGLLRARRRRARSTRRRSRRSIKCGAFGSTGASRKGMLAVLEQAQARRPEGSSSTPQIGQGSIFDLGDAGDAAAGRRPPARVRAVATRRSRPRSSSRPSCWPSRRSRSASSSRAHPLKEVREALRAAVDCPLAELRRAQGRRLGHGRRHHHAGQEDPHAEGRPDDVRHARRPRGQRSRSSSSARRWRSTRARSAVDEVVLVRGRVDHKDADKTCLVVQTRRALRADRRGGRGGARGARPRRARGPEPLRVLLDATRLPRLDHRRAQARARQLTPASARSCSTSTPPPGRGRCAWARATASSRRPACAPSWSTSWARCAPLPRRSLRSAPLARWRGTAGGIRSRRATPRSTAGPGAGGRRTPDRSSGAGGAPCSAPRSRSLRACLRSSLA